MIKNQKGYDEFIPGAAYTKWQWVTVLASEHALVTPN